MENQVVVKADSDESVIMKQLTPAQELRRNLLLSLQQNVFFDAVLASMAYTLLEDAFRTSEELRKYPFENTDITQVPGEELKNFEAVTTVICNEECAGLHTLIQNPEVVVDLITCALMAMLYSGDVDNTGRFVAGTLRLHLAINMASGRLGIQIIAIKHNKEVA